MKHAHNRHFGYTNSYKVNKTTKREEGRGGKKGGREGGKKGEREGRREGGEGDIHYLVHLFVSFGPRWII